MLGSEPHFRPLRDIPEADRPLVGRDQTVQLLGSTIAHGGNALSGVPELLKKVLREECWRDRIIEATGQRIAFDRFEDFVTRPPLEGLGATMDFVRKLVRDDAEALDLLDRVTVGKQGAHTDNVRVSDGFGNARQYALRKLRKDAPALHAKVLAGQLSPHRAMVQAGFRKQPTPLQQLERAWTKATAKERTAFLRWIKDKD